MHESCYGCVLSSPPLSWWPSWWRPSPLFRGRGSRRCQVSWLHLRMMSWKRGNGVKKTFILYEFFNFGLWSIIGSKKVSSSKIGYNKMKISKIMTLIRSIRIWWVKLSKIEIRYDILLTLYPLRGENFFPLPSKILSHFFVDHYFCLNNGWLFKLKPLSHPD